MRLKRFLIGAMVVGSLLGSAVGVSAAATNPNANCIGQFASDLNADGPGLGGRVVSFDARSGSGPGGVCSNGRE